MSDPAENLPSLTFVSAMRFNVVIAALVTLWTCLGNIHPSFAGKTTPLPNKVTQGTKSQQNQQHKHKISEPLFFACALKVLVSNHGPRTSFPLSFWLTLWPMRQTTTIIEMYHLGGMDEWMNEWGHAQKSSEPETKGAEPHCNLSLHPVLVEVTFD